MNGSWKDRKGVAAALGLVALLVWGSVGYTVWAGLQGEDDPVAMAVPLYGERDAVPMERAAYAYAGDFRDPFAPQLRAIVEEMPEPTAEAEWVDLPADPEPEWPDVKLLGIVGETALLEMGGYTQLVRVGDYLENWEVVQVRKEEVVLSLEAEQLTITIN